MMTKEVNAWIKKVQSGNYSGWEIMEEFAKFYNYLTPEEVEQIKVRLESNMKR